MTIPAVVMLWLAPSAGAAETPFAASTFREACAAGREADKPVLVYFSEPDNTQCDTYRELTWSDEAVTAWLAENVIAIEVPLDRGESLRKRFEVRSIPSVLVISPDQQVRARIVGFRDPTILLSEIKTNLRASDPVGLAETLIATSGDSPASLLMYAKTLEDAGRIEDALTHYLKCFDGKAQGTGGFGGVQLVVIDELGRLSGKHKRARKALIERRDASRHRILGGQDDRTDPPVLAATNAWLGNLDDTLAVLGQLQVERPDGMTVRLLRECAVDAALKVKAYDRITELIDIPAHANRAYEQYQRDTARPTPAGVDAERFRAFERNSFVERAVRFYEMLIGVGRMDDAATVASMLVTADDRAETWHALAQAALRTGRVGPTHLDQARRALGDSDPVDPECLATLLRVYIMLDQREDAARAFDTYAPRLSRSEDRDALRRLLSTASGQR